MEFCYFLLVFLLLKDVEPFDEVDHLTKFVNEEIDRSMQYKLPEDAKEYKTQTEGTFGIYNFKYILSVLNLFLLVFFELFLSYFLKFFFSS